MNKFFIAVSAVCVSTAAFGSTHFLPYEGVAGVERGEGGTRLERLGVDFWTTGTPPRAYKVLGVITDKREIDVFSGDAVGSKKVANMVRNAGGDAVIVVDRQDRTKGTYGHFVPNMTWRHGHLVRSRLGGGFINTTTATDAITQLTVIKYLD